MSGVFEIRENLNDSSVKGELVDIMGEYNQLCTSLQATTNSNFDNEVNDNDNAKTNTKCNPSKKNFIETLCERLKPDILDDKPDSNVCIRASKFIIISTHFLDYNEIGRKYVSQRFGELIYLIR